MCPYHVRGLTGELVRSFVARGAGVSFHLDQVYRPLPGCSAHGGHPPLDADDMFLAWSGSSVPSYRNGTCRVQMNHEGAAHVVVVQESENCPLDC
jgi:hypothetical protein